MEGSSQYTDRVNGRRRRRAQATKAADDAATQNNAGNGQAAQDNNAPILPDGVVQDNDVPLLPDGEVAQDNDGAVPLPPDDEANAEPMILDDEANDIPVLLDGEVTDGDDGREIVFDDWKKDPGERSRRIWEWWRSLRGRGKLQHFCTAARLVVLTQVSSAAVERTFSVLKNLRDNLGDNLTEDALEMRLYMRCNEDLRSQLGFG